MEADLMRMATMPFLEQEFVPSKQQQQQQQQHPQHPQQPLQLQQQQPSGLLAARRLHLTGEPPS